MGGGRERERARFRTDGSTGTTRSLIRLHRNRHRHRQTQTQTHIVRTERQEYNNPCDKTCSTACARHSMLLDDLHMASSVLFFCARWSQKGVCGEQKKRTCRRANKHESERENERIH